MTAPENVLTSVLFNEKKYSGKIDGLARAQELLGFVGLGKEKFNVPAKNLNVVELRRIQLAKALATSPKLLLLDELLTGLTPKECDEAIELIKLINKQGVTVLIVEHVMRVIMGLCDRVIVLHHGEKICEGSPKQVCSDENVVKVYLGKRFTVWGGRIKCLKSKTYPQPTAWCKFCAESTSRLKKKKSLASSVPTEQEKPPL